MDIFDDALGGIFDIDGDGEISPEEAVLGFMIFEECTGDPCGSEDED